MCLEDTNYISALNLVSKDTKISVSVNFPSPPLCSTGFFLLLIHTTALHYIRPMLTSQHWRVVSLLVEFVRVYANGGIHLDKFLANFEQPGRYLRNNKYSWNMNSTHMYICMKPPLDKCLKLLFASTDKQKTDIYRKLHSRIKLGL